MDEVPTKGTPCGPKCKSRFIVALLASAALAIVYGLRVTLHVLMVVMVNHTAITAGTNGTSKSGSSSCHFIDKPEEVEKEDGPFEWDSEVQGIILSAYFASYILTQVPGGRMAELFSVKWVLFFSVAVTVAGTVLCPLLAKIHYGALIFARLLQGLGGGVIYPGCHVLLSQWAPPTERSFLSSLVYAGSPMGTVIFMLLSGLLASAVSWEAAFYIQALLSSLWLPAWVWLVADTPAQQKLISAEEREFITTSFGAQTGEKRPRPRVPWKSVFTSTPFWAILTCHACGNWGWYMNLIELPQFMKHVLEFDIKQNAALTALPYMMMYIFSLSLGRILDTLKKRKKLSNTAVRKTATGIASFGPVACYVVLCVIGCQRALAVVLMSAAVMTAGGAFPGYLANHLDISPNFAGTLIAITNTAATVPGILVPIVVGRLTHDDQSMSAWRKNFFIAISMYSFQIVIYLIFASGEIQEWNDPKQATESEEGTSEKQ